MGDLNEAYTLNEAGKYWWQGVAAVTQVRASWILWGAGGLYEVRNANGGS